ncbi:hypothetical protein [Anabaena sp. CCY 9402-a]|uniref:hypothetical protein n=1 Tax=Anabaena sp. CCY 9402-a TaxID=3103867 RepID=UPI0039C6F65D
MSNERLDYLDDMAIKTDKINLRRFADSLLTTNYSLLSTHYSLLITPYSALSTQHSALSTLSW